MNESSTSNLRDGRVAPERSSTEVRSQHFGKELAVVVVTYSPGATLDEFVRSLDNQQPITDLRLVLSDNGSRDGVPERVAAERPKTTLLINSSNPGYGAAVNSAVATLDDSFGWVLVCNPDVRLEPGAIAELLRVLQSDETIGSVGPRIIDDAGNIYPSARRLPSFRDGIGHALLVNRWPGNPWSRRYRQEEVSQAEQPTSTGWLSGACLLIRRRALQQVQGFDPSFFMYFEDVDLGKRLGEAGWSNVFVPSAQIVHVGGASTSRYPERMLRAHHASAYLYLSKKYPQGWMAPALWVAKAGLEVRARLELRRALSVRQHGDSHD